MALTVRPCTLKEANALVASLHRHHKPARGCRFCLSLFDGERICGVAIVGRPSARMLDDGLTAEVLRVATDGTRNACSALLAACWRAWKAMGGGKLVTYTLPEEGGASLRGAGWRLVDEAAGGGSWSRDGRERQDDLFPQGPKWRWEAVA